MDSTRQLFQRHSLRCTRQRMAVYEALRGCTTHPTAEQLYRIVHLEAGSLSLATVYNTLEVLCDAGLIRRMPTTNGCCRYDADTSNHLHVRFRDTAEIEDVPDELSRRILDHLPPELLEDVARKLGVRVESVSIQLIAKRR